MIGKILVIVKIVIQILTVLVPLVRGIRDTIQGNFTRGTERRKYTTRF